ncbi:MAG: winged helix-turn-helix domain-containing protein [Brachybacterium sp.]|uniref:winged helix-turn-helix domain-containing protein n=1 Tax=Brachybacterium sp. TaxID=1891286 RepID=UPI0026485371|nr:winged helix-turn-helix domain-containing protein [Brachybacterium sp.]MDN5688649.1 winged helix-turn-helix domain-containing protein [Brachybacterium sp.]
MTIALDRPTSAQHTAPTRSLHRAGGTAPRPQAAEEGVTITVSVTLPSGTGDVEAALIADDLRTHAQRLTATRDGRTTVGVSHPSAFAAARSTRATARTLPPRGQGSAAVSPLRPRGAGVVSPNSPARKDAETARRRALRATAVSPSSPAVATEDSLVIDLFGRRVRIDGQDVDLTYKEFELLAELARNARRTISRDQLMSSVWAEAPEDTGERTVDVHVRRVRTKLARYRRLISTVRGAGYRLDPGSDVAIIES